MLILVSQNADTLIIKYLGTEAMKKELSESTMKQRGNPPTALEWLVVAYIMGELSNNFNVTFSKCQVLRG